MQIPLVENCVGCGCLLWVGGSRQFLLRRFWGVHDRLLIIVVPLCEGGPVLSVAAVVKATIIGLETVNHRFAPDTVFIVCSV